MISQKSVKKTGQFTPFSFSASWKTIGLLFVLFLFFLPVIRLIWLSVISEGTFTLEEYSSVLSERMTWLTIQNTLYIVAGSTVFSVILGIFLAWIIAYVDIRGKNWMQLFIFLPFIIPSYISTLAWVQFFGKTGPFAFFNDLLSLSLSTPNLYSMGGIIFVLGITNYPLVYLLSVDVFKKIPRELEEAAWTSGASRFVLFWKVVFPMALPGIASGGLLAFISNLDNFGVPAFLGIPANIKVLSTYIYEQIVGFGPSAFARAAVLSVILGLVAISGTIIQWVITRKNKVNETNLRDNKPRIFLGKYKQIVLEAGIWFLLIMTSLVPFITMAATSLIKAYGLPFRLENLSFKNYYYVLFEDQKMISAITNSLFLGGITLVICLITGTMIAYFRYKRPSHFIKFTEIIVTIPYALPGTVLALAIILMWIQPIPGWKPGVYGTIWILVIAYFTRFLILQVRGSITAFSQLDPSMEEAALTSGANGFAKWRKILLPLLLPGIVGGGLLVFLTALTELTVSSLLWSSGSETIGVMIFSFEQAGYSTYSTAFSSVIVFSILIGAAICVWFQKLWSKRMLRNK
ncbi:ABC transporter permease [Metabacillus arenae]|uniref:Iron ABC transporter permease n=1 Tax=Metabacillus arenae TaxID=2771434 RepID=A0A926RYK1_9BACI|nr:iron ABC transporter permease [Metabacillus arenae]MBD1383028.1 iron ABC transporter permease [Metabacillus arenae]